MNLQSSTLKIDESGKPFHVQQAEQIRAYRAAWKEAGHTREPRVSVSRSIFALVDDRDRAYFGRGGESEDQIGYIEPEQSAPSSAAATPPSRTCSSKQLDGGRGHRRGRHAAPDRAQPARRRLQRPRHRGDPEARRAGAGLARKGRRGPPLEAQIFHKRRYENLASVPPLSVSNFFMNQITQPSS